MIDRRAFLGGLAALTGCLGTSGSGGNGDLARTDEATPTPTTSGQSETTGLPEDEDPADGYPPALGETPTERTVDVGAFGTVKENGVEVPLAPVDVAHYWFRRRAARFADARSLAQYEQSHILGAVSSPAPDGGDDDPVAAWPKGDRIVCYCGCPHHLSSIRASNLLNAGYERVYVIDEGFWEWHDRGYPMRGTDVSVRPQVRVVRGRTAPQYAGETAWAVHEASGQREAAPITADGSYRLELKFAGVTPASVVRIRTPAYEVSAPLAELTDGTVAGP